MSSLFFWKAWPRSIKYVYQFLLMLLAISLLYYLIGYFWSSRLVIQWETISQIRTLPLLLESFNYALIPLNITVDHFVTSQTFAGSDLQFSEWPAYALLALMGCCLVVVLALATDLSRFWFLVSQIVFIFILVAFKLEQLLMFDRTDKVALIVAFLLFLPLGYYFHALNKDAALRSRILAFSMVTLVFGLIIYFFSGVSKPFLYLVNYGIVVPIALTVIFILITAHEIIYGFLFLITRSNTPNSSNSFFHFFAISFIYLGNVLLLYLKNTRRIDWDFYYLDAFWILIATTAIGIWGLKQRRGLFQNIVAFQPHAALGYLGLAIVSFSTIGYYFSTANDPAIEAFEDVIVFGQLSIGFLFLLYILFNFRSVLVANLKVYKVVYKPQKMPFFSMRLGGLIGVLGLFLLSNQYPLNQAITGYYNGIGDLHREDGKPFLAKEYYKLAAIYAKTNHRSNYAVAAMSQQERKYPDALRYYKQSLLKQPTPFAYVNVANLYQKQGSFFQAMFTLKEGLKKFPGNGQIANNLAMMYAQTDILDSAWYFLEGNANQKRISTITQANKLALLTRAGVDLSIDSLLESTNYGKPEVGSNLLMMASQQHKGLSKRLQIPTDSLLNPLTFSWWYNYSINARHEVDTLRMSFLKRVALMPENGMYAGNLDFSRALGLYYSGDVAAAFSLMRNMQFLDSQKSGYYNDLLGLWSLENGAPRLARDHFDQSARAQYVPALWHQSLALLSLGSFELAQQYWENFQRVSAEPPDGRMAELMRFCQKDTVDRKNLNAHQKLWYLQFKTPATALDQKIQLMDEIGEAGVKEMGLKHIMLELLGAGEISRANTLFDAYSTEASMDHLLWRIRLAILTEDYDYLKTQIPLKSDQSRELAPWLAYVKALLAESAGDQDLATGHYREVVKNPFFTDGIIGAARYSRQVKKDENEAYSILLEALDINMYSVDLLKAYGLQCVRLNLDTYRQSANERLEELLDPGAYQEYLQEQQVLATEVESEMENWDS